MYDVYTLNIRVCRRPDTIKADGKRAKTLRTVVFTPSPGPVTEHGFVETTKGPLDNYDGRAIRRRSRRNGSEIYERLNTNISSPREGGEGGTIERTRPIF